MVSVGRYNIPQERPAACQCAYCHDDIIVGTEAWRVVGSETTACSIRCLVRLTEDIDEFERQVIDEK